MTLKRYQPQRKRKRASKKNRPLKIALALGVVGVAIGIAYVGLHGEVLVGLLDGSVDLPDHRFAKPKAATPTATPLAKPHGNAPRLVTASPASVKMAQASAMPLKAAVPSASPTTMAAASPKPSAFPEGGKPAKPVDDDNNPIAEASPLKPAGIASFQPAKVAAKPVAAKAPAAKPSPVVVAKASPKPPAVVLKASPKPVAVAAKPSPRPVSVKKAVQTGPAKPEAKPKATPAKVAAAATRRVGALYFDKNSSYLSSAEKDRLAALVAGIKQRGGTIHVSGYADAVGDVGYNRWMAQRRASRVADFIRSQLGGKATVVVDTVGSVGRASGTDGDRQNRRVEVEVR